MSDELPTQAGDTEMSEDCPQSSVNQSASPDLDVKNQLSEETASEDTTCDLVSEMLAVLPKDEALLTKPPAAPAMLARLNEIPAQFHDLVKALVAVFAWNGHPEVEHFIASLMLGVRSKALSESNSLLEWLEIDLIQIAQLSLGDLCRSIAKSSIDLSTYVEKREYNSMSRSEALTRAKQSSMRIAVIKMFLQVHLSEAWHPDQITPHAEPFYKNLNTVLKPLSEGSEEVRLLKLFFRGYVPEKATITKRKLRQVLRKAVEPHDRIKPLQVFSIAREAERNKFDSVPKTETCLFFHGTNFENLPSIFTHGLVVSTERTYGPPAGLWFSHKAETASSYSRPRNDGQAPRWYLLVAEVHLGDTNEPKSWINAPYVVRGDEEKHRSCFEKLHDVRLPDGTLLPQNNDGNMIINDAQRAVLRYLVEFTIF